MRSNFAHYPAARWIGTSPVSDDGQIAVHLALAYPSGEARVRVRMALADAAKLAASITDATSALLSSDTHQTKVRLVFKDGGLHFQAWDGERWYSRPEEDASGEGVPLATFEPASSDHASTGFSSAGLIRFCTTWPGLDLDDPVEVAAAWCDLSPAQQRAALRGIPIFLSEREALQLRRLPAPLYLRERRWELAPGCNPTGGRHAL